MHERPAGFRTHILVSVGSALIMIVSMYMHILYPEADPARIASSIVSGIGFLGAGTIIREGVSIKGLTTAASLWTVAGIGMAIGGGFYYSALATTTIVFVVLFFLNSWEHHWSKKRECHGLFVEIKDRSGNVRSFDSILEAHRLIIYNIRKERREEAFVFSVYFKAPPGVKKSAVTEEFLSIDGVREVRWDYM